MNSLRLARLFLSVSALFSFHPSIVAAKAPSQNSALPLAFEENRGQAPSQYRYLSYRGGMETMFLPDGVDFLLPETKDGGRLLELKLVRSSTTARIEPVAPTKGQSNYLLGTDPSRWIQHVPNYSLLEYKAVYPGVGLVFYGNGGKLEHDFQIAAGADVSQIALRIDGADKVDVSKTGDLLIHLGKYVLVMDKPVAYQTTTSGREPVRAAFAMADNGEIRFQVGKYDHGRLLVIDPALSFATYLDKLSVQIAAVAVDTADATYVTGITFSSSYAVTAGAFQTTCKSCSANLPSVFVTKLNSTGTEQVYSTFLGGSAYNQPFGLAVDGSGNAVVVGRTESTDFPLKNPIGVGTAGNGAYLGFIASLTPDGSGLNYSSLLGGGRQPGDFSETIANAVAVDASGNAYVTGTTDSPVYPVTTGALNSGAPQYPESIAFVSKFVPAGSLGYSALIGDVTPQNGGAGLIGVSGIGVDSQGSAYITGGAGTLWPTTSGAYQPQIPGSPPYSAPFITKLSPDASKLAYSTFLGTGNAVGIALDAKRDAFITGIFGNSFPVTSNAYLSSQQECCGFLSEISPDGSQLVYSTFLGSGTTSGTVFPTSIAVDPEANIWVGGSTSDLQFPMMHPLQSIPILGPLGNNGFVSEFDPTGATLKFSTYFGEASPGVNAIAIDSIGNAHISGMTVAGIFPSSGVFYTTPGAFLGSVTPPPPNNEFTYGYAALIDASKSSSAVCLDPTSKQGVSFGYVPVDTKVTQTITVTNCGNSQLSIASVQSSDPAFTIPAGSNHCGSPVASGATCSLDVTFSPTSVVGYSALLTFTSNASIPTAFATIGGSGAVPVASVSPGALQFDPLLVGQSSGQSPISVDNSGNADLTVDLAHTTISGDFTYGDLNCASPVLHGGFCTLFVTFKPTQAGNRTGTLTIATNDPVNPKFTVGLSGMGLTSYPVPTIASFDSPTIPTGDSPVTVRVFGTNFFPTSVVRIEGKAQPTTYRSTTEVDADVDPALRTDYSELAVTVFNPTPGGGESAALLLTTYRSIALSATGLIYEPVSKLLYAAIPSTATSNPNTIIPIDPVSGEMKTPIPVGNNPNKLAISADGSYLYVALDGDHAVQRINLQTLSVEKTFQLPVDPTFGELTVHDMKVVPGSPKSVAVILFRSASPAEDGAALFNDAGLVNFIPNDYANSLSIDSFSFAASPSVLYALPFGSPNKGLFFTEVTIDSSGMHFDKTGGTPPGGGTTLQVGYIVTSDGTSLFTNLGEVWNPTTQKLLGTYTLPGGAQFLGDPSVVPDGSAGRTFFLAPATLDTGAQSVNIDAFKVADFTFIGALPFTSILEPDALDLVRWGTNGFAFRVFSGFGGPGDQLILVRSSLSGQQVTNPNPVPTITTLLPSSAIAGGSTFTLTVNGAGFIQGSVVLWNNSPLATTYISSAQLSAVVPTADIAQAGSAQVNVMSPTPGGGTSSASTFTVVAAAPKVAFSVASLDFGDVAQGTSSSAQSLTLTNIGNVGLSISNVAITGDFSQTNTCGASLPASATCQVAIVFTPTTTGQRTGTLTLTDNASDSPQTLALKGNGAVPVAIGPGGGGSTTATVSSGQTATYNLSVSGSNGFSGTVALACAGAPQNAQCSILPTSMTLPADGSASFTVTVSTGHAATAYLPQHSDTLMAGLGMLAFLSVPILISIRKRVPQRLQLAYAIGAMWLITLVATGCGGSAGQPSAATPPGTYTLSVTATAGGTTVTQNLTLVVQ